MIKNISKLPLKKTVSIIVGLLVTFGILQQGDFLTKILLEGEQYIPEDVVVGDVITKNNKEPTPTESIDSKFNGPYEVVKIADGDTLTVVINGEEERVRLLGIDTPETAKYGNSDECYAQEAFTKLTSLLPVNSSVYLEYDEESQGLRDTNDRLLAYVYKISPESSLNINEYLVREGFAYEFTYNKPYEYQAVFIEAEKEAKNAQRGLWGVCK